MTQQEILELDSFVDSNTTTDEAGNVELIHDGKLCSVWAIIKPIIKAVRWALFFKPKWKAALDKAVEFMDKECIAN